MNIQYLNCSEVIVITISHVHRIELLGISNFNHIFFLDVKDVNTMVIHIYCQYTTLIVFCDTVVYTLDPSYKKHICVNDVYTVVITIGI